MHTPNCACANCCSHRFPLLTPQRSQPGRGAAPLNEEEEVELAMELLGVSSEEEWEQFLGKIFKKVGQGLKKVGSAAGKMLKPLGGMLKGVAKQALPFVGGALGSFIPIPGVGTALGTALGSAVGKALETEMNELEQDEAEFEMARRFVRIATSATQQALSGGDRGDPSTAVRDALVSAARQHVPRLDQRIPARGLAQGASFESECEFEGECEGEGEDEGEGEGGWSGGMSRPAGPAMSGRWMRRGRRIVLMDL
jgi:hypothetical protein